MSKELLYDPYFESVETLVSGDKLADSSKNKYPVVTDGTVYPFHGYGQFGFSLYYPPVEKGIPLFLKTLSRSNISAKQDFTIELNFRYTSLRTGFALLSTRNKDAIGSGLLIGVDEFGRLFVKLTADSKLVFQFSSKQRLKKDVFYDICLERKNGRIKVYIDNHWEQDIYHSDIWDGKVDNSGNLYLGCDVYAAPLVGNISQVRNTVGVARYDGDYPPQVKPFYTYGKTPPVLFGDPSEKISTIGFDYNCKIDIKAIDSISVYIEDFNGGILPISPDWSITPLYDKFLIEGTPPTSNGFYFVHLTGMTSETYGSVIVDYRYRVTNTSDGYIEPGQEIFGKMNTVGWIDSNDQTIQKTNYIVDKATALLWGGEYTKNNGTLGLPAIDGLRRLTLNTPIVLNTQPTMIFLVVNVNPGIYGSVFEIASTVRKKQTDIIASFSLTNTATGLKYTVTSDDKDGGVAIAVSTTLGGVVTICFMCDDNGVRIYENQKPLSVTTSGTLDTSNYIGSVLGVMNTIGTPFVALGEMLIINDNIGDSGVMKVFDYLNTKWNLYPTLPTVDKPVTLAGRNADIFTTMVTTTNTDTLSVISEPPLTWDVIKVGSNVYSITSTMPTDPLGVKVTVTATNQNGSIDESFIIQLSPNNTAPYIGPLVNSRVPMGTWYASLIHILNSVTVSVKCQTGSGWKIEPYDNHNGIYLVTGFTQSSPGTCFIEITAVGQDGKSVKVTAPVIISQAYTPGGLEYPYDVSGGAPSNRITGECHTVTFSNKPGNWFITPNVTPFYTSGFKLYQLDYAGRPILIPTNEYRFEYVDKERASERIADSVRLMLPQEGVYYIDYQAVGGNGCLNRKFLTDIVLKNTFDGRVIDFSAIDNPPSIYRQGAHSLNITDSTSGYTRLIYSLNEIALNIKPALPVDILPFAAHIADVKTNPHGANKFSVNLENVQNYPLSTEVDIRNTTNDVSYLTPYMAYKLWYTYIMSDVYGKVTLNWGTSIPKDADDRVRALTSGGFLKMLKSPFSNTIKDLFPASFIKCKIDPLPDVYPVYWDGVECRNLDQFFNAIETYLGVTGIYRRRSTGEFWYPSHPLLPTTVDTTWVTDPPTEPTDTEKSTEHLV